jgi:hypothetical protein
MLSGTNQDDAFRAWQGENRSDSRGYRGDLQCCHAPKGAMLCAVKTPNVDLTYVR